MNSRLASSAFIAAGTCTLADFALYPYTHWSDQAGIDLTAYEHVRRWLTRVEAEPRFLAPGIEGAVEVVSFDEYFK
jgi:glutathione S-transferase